MTVSSSCDTGTSPAAWWVCDIYVGADAFLLVAALIWSCMLQPDENMLVSAAWAAHGAPGAALLAAPSQPDRHI